MTIMLNWIRSLGREKEKKILLVEDGTPFAVDYMKSMSTGFKMEEFRRGVTDALRGFDWAPEICELNSHWTSSLGRLAYVAKKRKHHRALLYFFSPRRTLDICSTIVANSPGTKYASFVEEENRNEYPRTGCSLILTRDLSKLCREYRLTEISDAPRLVVFLEGRD